MAAGYNTEVGVRGEFERAFEPGELVFEEGEPGDSLYVVQSGEVELIRSSGASVRSIDRVGPGEFFGEMSVVLGGLRTVSARAVTETHLIELDGSTLQEMCVERPEVGLRLIRRLAARVIELEKQVFALGADDLLRLVVDVLIRRAESTAEGARIDTTLRDVARDAGLSLEEAHRVLQKLFERKLVRLSDDVLYTSDLDALARLAQQPAAD